MHPRLACGCWCVLDGSNECRQGLGYGDMFHVQVVVGSDLTAIVGVGTNLGVWNLCFHRLGLFVFFLNPHAYQ
jgi:hypothetical protein